MQTIKLDRGEWQIDTTKPLGPEGGFGEVFEGTGDGQRVAIKRLKMSAATASHREMSIGAALAEREYDHVVPVLDFGQDADGERYYLVMPVCERSLQDQINGSGALKFTEAKAAIIDILSGLAEVGDIVHRDLKPGNVLWHDGRWKIADFGIAKFVEDSTSLETLRSSLTPAYAAPEQWRGERPTQSTDIYALGCIIHAIINGQPPFTGDADDIREGHLHTPATSLAGVDPRFAGLVNTMLRKSAASRPTLARCKSVVENLRETPVSTARAALAAAGRAVSEEEAAAEAEKSARDAARRERESLEADGHKELRAMLDRLFDEIENSSESVKRNDRVVALGPAQLTYDLGSRTSLGRDIANIHRVDHNHGWDVAANAYMNLSCNIGQPTPYRPGKYIYSTTLAFATTPGDQSFRWRELSFMETFSVKPMHEQPIALNPLGEEFAVAVSTSITGRHQIACGPWNIDGEDEDDFQERWLKLFAKAASRQLQPPSALPLNQSFFA